MTSNESEVRKRFIGVWKLLSVEVRAAGEILYPYGEHPVGRLTYDAAGRTSAQVMKLGRRSSVKDPGAISQASDEEVRQIADGYIGYYGTFSIDGEAVIHHVEACTLPAWIDTGQRRQYEFTGSRLVLRFDPYQLVWERLPD